MTVASLHDLLVDELKDLFSAEHQLFKALPRMARAAHNPELRTAFEKHLQETHGHAQRLEQICDSLDARPRGKKCVAMEGLIEEGKELLEEGGPVQVLDAGLIGAAQKVEHYEMAAYGTARAHAQLLGYRGVVDLLQQTLDEESAANDKLSQIAESTVNLQAVRSGNGQRQGAS